MKFIIYTLNGCRECIQREDIHNDIAELLDEMGVSTVGIKYGQVDGVNYYPLEEHDKLCRKTDDSSKYVAPVYIFEDDENVIKMPDVSQYPTASTYSAYVGSVMQQLGYKRS
jgi:hypothetical protein